MTLWPGAIAIRLRVGAVATRSMSNGNTAGGTCSEICGWLWERKPAASLGFSLVYMTGKH